MLCCCWVEDSLHQDVVGRVCAHLGCIEPRIIQQGGKSKMIDEKRVRHLHRSASANRFFILVDLDNDSTCAPTEKKRLLGKYRATTHLKLIIAVREAESWLLADRGSMAKFLRVAATHLPRQPESENDPKGVIVKAARKSRNRVIREAISAQGAVSQGPDYNSTIRQYVAEHWDIGTAKQHSPSLNYLCRTLKNNLPKR